MKKLLTLLLSLFILSTYGFGQYSMVELNGQTISTCYDSLSVNNYTIGQTYTITICSENTIAKHMKFSIMNGHSFPEGATLYIYDGNSTEAPLMTYWNNETSSNHYLGVIAGEENESGCLTLVFTSNVAGATLGRNKISCDFVCQTRSVEITSTTPPLVDEQYVNICWDEENNQSFPITFNAQGTYPELAYECNDATNTFYWDFDDGSPIVSGLGLTSVTHSFSKRRGYNVIVNIQDSYNCRNTNYAEKRVRVSLPPIWDNSTTVLTTDPQTNPPITCMGSPVNACAYYSNPYWTNIIPFTSDEIVHIPDTPPICHESMLYIDEFLPGKIITSINDIVSIDMILCHERLGDLTIDLICPNATQVRLVDQGGDDTMLGLPGTDANNFYDDEGWLYSIMPTASQTMQEAANGQTNLPSGEYASYQSFNSLIGCSINGDWYLRLCDNESQNSGTIFGWSIRFNENVYQSVWDYTQTYTPTLWEGLYGSVINDPNNQNCMTGTYITSNTPNESSLQPFTFTVTDNFGCAHDTSLYVTVNPMPEQVVVSQSPENGILSEGTSGSITIENSIVETNYWASINGTNFTEEISGTGSELSLGNNFTDGSYDIKSRNQYGCSSVQGIANFVTEVSGTNKIVANVSFGTPASNFPANHVNVKLYKATTNNETIVLVAEQLLSSNGQVEFTNLETGDYYLGSFIQYPD
ncbi:MAG: proprotein convertase P-domain-containing protein, partial [Bacteroidales bacterium]